MAVYTEIAPDDLTAYLAQYDLGTLLSCEGIEEGVENSNYRLTMDSGLYILTLYEKRVKESDLPFFVSLMDHLTNNNFVCPRPQKMKSGEVIGRISDRPCTIVSFLVGKSISDPDPSQCRLGGETLARLQLSSTDFTGTRKNALDISGWSPLLESCQKRADEVESGLCDLITEQFQQLTQEWPTTLPTGIIHADFFKDNIFFRGDDVSGVIDFYFSCNDILAYDLAIAINAWCFSPTHTFLPDHCRQFIAGYESLRLLSTDEKQMLDTLARGASLRFLLTRLYDWLNVPKDALVTPHDPKDFSARLRYFSTHSLTEYL